MNRILITLITAAFIIAAGVWHGTATGRWGETHELQDAVARVKAMPFTVGDWISKDLAVNPRHLEVGEIAGHLSRTFVHKISGESINILLVLGKPGPIAVHSPDVCFEGAGYKMGPKTTYALKNASVDRYDEFWSAKFTKDPQPAPLHILWAWTTGGLWMAPDNPRLTFYRSPVLFKLYIIREVKAQDAPMVDETMQLFIKDVLPALKATITGQPAAPAQ